MSIFDLNPGVSIKDTGKDAAESGAVPYASYQYGADAHNYGNGNFAFTDPTTWGQGASNAVKFVGVSIASGLNSFYNTGVAVSNWLGSDAKQNDVAVQLGMLDDDLGKYYQENRESADLAGFIVGAMVPGLAGIKLLNAGQKALSTAKQTGVLGANMSRATGLLAPSTKAYTSLASAEIAQSSAAFSMTTGNALKAVGAGYGQAALEAAAFEIAVNATMFKSPILNDQDGWDIAKHMAMGVAIGGVIGGAINHAVTYGAIKKGVKDFNIAEKQFANTSDLTSLTASQQIIVRNDRLSTIPQIPSTEAIISGEFEGATKILEGLYGPQKQIAAEQLGAKLGKLREETIRTLELDNQKSFQAIVSGAGKEGTDVELANQMATLTKGLSGNQTFANLESLTEMGRISHTLKAEKEIEAFIKKQAKTLEGTLDDVEEIGKLPYKVGYVKLNGEGVGDVMFDTPKVLSLGDMTANKAETLAAVKSFGFKETKPWNAMEAVSHNEAEARFIWADSVQLKEGAKIGEHDIPLLERAMAQKIQNIEVISAAGNYQIRNGDDLMKHLELSKQEVAMELINAKKAGVSLTTEEIAKITNVRLGFLEGEVSNASASIDLFARQANKADFEKSLQSKGYSPNEITQKVEDFYLQPTYAKAAYDTKIAQAVDANEVAGMAYIKAQQKQYQNVVDNVFAKAAGEQAGKFWHAPDELWLKTNRFGAGPGVFTFANGGYHTPESFVESIGAATASWQREMKSATSEKLQSSLHKIVSNQDVAIEFESINKTLMSTSEHYAITADGSAIKSVKILDWEAAVAAGKNGPKPVLQEGAPEIIPVQSADVLEAWIARTELTNARTTGLQEVRNAQGLTDMKDARVLRPIRPDPKDFPFYAVVVDESITGVGHKSMIHANSAKELDAMIQKVPSNYTTLRGKDMDEYFKANGGFDYERTLNENYINGDLKRNGVNNPFFIQTDPQKIAQRFLQDHMRSDDIFIREMVNAKYEKEFSFLRQQGDQFNATATSRYNSYKDLENTSSNPYTSYMKTALNISQINDHPYLMGLNQKLDTGVSKVWNTIDDAIRGMKSPEDLDKINASLTKFGVKSAYYDAATNLLANHTAPKGVLTNFVTRANTILSTLVTRLDPLNAINNAVGSTILYSTELKSVFRSLQGDEALMGELNGLVKTSRASEASLNPATAGNVEQILTQGKVMRNAAANFWNKEATTASGIPLKEYYKANGWSTRIMDQAHQMMEDLTLRGAETVGVIQAKEKSAFTLFKTLAEKGEKFTGNRLAEEFNRFVSADAMRQITEVAVKAGKITEQEQVSFINTFVNRTQGNILATQRPLMFQGPIGKAVGLFQSYQFNLMQQLFRHIGEGSGKDAAMLMGLQGTMYGMNGLPAFNFINQHIVGTASGNPEHKDLYSATYGIAGKSVGDLLLYGLPSNLMQANLYTRGDINPRQVSIIPVNPLDIPFVSATMKAYDNVSNSLKKMANGGAVWETMLQGIEHNGVSRPLAGFAQVAQAAGNGGMVYSTTNKGTISGANELFSWSTIARLAGGKPFDQAVVNDQVFRVTAYQAADRKKLDMLSRTVKSSLIAGNIADEDQIATFAARYAAIGGRQENFNKYMMEQMSKANTAKANAIAENLKSPYARKMQQTMGGTDYLDGRSFGD